MNSKVKVKVSENDETRKRKGEEMQETKVEKVSLERSCGDLSLNWSYLTCREV